MDCTADESKAFKDKMGIKGFPSFRVRACFTPSPLSTALPLPPRVLPYLIVFVVYRLLGGGDRLACVVKLTVLHVWYHF